MSKNIKVMSLRVCQENMELRTEENVKVGLFREGGVCRDGDEGLCAEVTVLRVRDEKRKEDGRELGTKKTKSD